MNKFRTLVLITALLANFGAAVPSSVAREATSPLGFKIFCVKNPQQCVASSKASLALTDDVMSQLKKVNLSVNRSIRPRHDRDGKDVWTVNASAGDCEDYVLTKRARIIAMGLPAGALRIATAKTRRGEGHAVLVVRTNKGDYVLDNLTNTIRPMAQTGLRFVAMSGADPRKWAAI